MNIFSWTAFCEHDKYKRNGFQRKKIYGWYFPSHSLPQLLGFIIREGLSRGIYRYQDELKAATSVRRGHFKKLRGWIRYVWYKATTSLLVEKNTLHRKDWPIVTAERK